jgi:hypothetical protein
MNLLTSNYPTEALPKMVRLDPHETSKAECGRLMHAAIINKRFCQMLLSNPIKSIENGYCGEKFSFTREEKERINSIRALTLDEFATQLIKVIEMPVVSEYAYINA